ncbi:hypothetical protein AWV80_23820 [Cupriavidus sp. UYMU48A]|nr:hypothetical protein AWV80_23820 [Cupriavidus sp. UYMU48A]
MVAASFTMLSRELWRLRAQVAAAALVVACGIAVLVAMNGAWRSLASAKDRYYEMQRFADVFANVKRAPVSLEGPIRAIPGVRESSCASSMTLMRMYRARASRPRYA